MGADIFEFEPGRVYLVQFPSTHLYIIQGPIVEDGPEKWEHYFADKKQALLLKEVKFITGHRSNNRHYLLKDDSDAEYITLRFMHPKEPSKTLEWSGFVNHPFRPEAAIRSACSIFRPLEYHDRYKNFWKKRNRYKEEKE